MYKQSGLKILFLLLLCTYGSLTYSQITTNTTQGCAPLNVTFNVSGNPSSPSWTFGIGQGTSLQTGGVSHIYTTPGSYNVTYTAVIGGSPVSYNTQITVHPNPTGNISVSQPASHCAPMTVTYTGSGGSAGSTYNWVFGDLTGGSGSSIPHTYNNAGNFTPTMTVVDGVTGCSSQAAFGAVTHISTPPVANIVANPGLSACTAPFTTFFSSNATSGSPVTGALTYSWTFGNSTPPSTQANPGNVTYAQGQFPVTLVVTDDNACSTTVSSQVSVTQPSLAVIVPPVVCIGDTFGISIKATQVQSTWLKGDNTIETFTVPGVNSFYGHTLAGYSTPGPKNLIISITAGTCSASQTASLFVEQVIASFTSTPPNLACSNTMICNYINSSSSNYPGATLSYQWVSMGLNTNPASYNHATNTLVATTNATFGFYQNSLNPYTIYANLIPAIGLNVTSNSPAHNYPFGQHCKAGLVQYLDTLIRPVAYFNKDKSEGCAPLVVTLRDTSFVHLPNYAITSYTWNSGTTPATVVTGVLTPPATITPQTFTYTSPGTYTPFLTIQTAGGCDDVSFIDTVRVVGPSTLSATFPTLVCIGQPVSIHLTASPTQTAIDHWHVSTDAGFFSGCVDDPDPTFIFTHVGTHTVGLTAYQKGCMSSTVMPEQITVKGPMGRTRWYTDCASATQVTFATSMQEVQTATLNFGDGSPQYTIAGNPAGSLSNTVMHTYTPSPLGNATYIATLTLLNPTTSCNTTMTQTMEVKVRTPQAVMYVNGSPTFPTLPSPLVCTAHSIVFDASHSKDAFMGCQTGYRWYLSSPPAAVNQPVVDSYTSTYIASFPTPGVYTLTLKIKDEFGCSSSVTRQFRVSSAPPAFSFSVNPVCLSDSAKVINTTTTTTLNPDPYTQYTWNFGDGSPTLTTTASPAVISHSYTSAQSPYSIYYVTATATNTFGCTNVLIKTLKVNKPAALFFPASPVACVPQAVIFNPQNSYPHYSISYSDSAAGPAVTSHSTFIHNYLTAGTHSITLTVTDSAGCRNTSGITFNAYVMPVASFTTVGAANYCAGATVNFTSTSSSSDPVHSPIISTIWTIGSATSPPTTFIPAILPAGFTTVNITVSTSPFCTATASLAVYGYSTHATLVLNKTKFCVGETIEAHLTGVSDVAGWLCNVGFGIEPSATPVSPFQSLSYTYTNAIQTGTAPVVATIHSPNDGCTDTTNSFIIEVVKLNADFKRNLELLAADSAHCLRLSDVFTHTINPTSDALSYTWDFGNGNTTTAPNPVYTYTAPGVYSVHLSVKDNDIGCLADAAKNMTIFALPSATVFAANNCPDHTFTVSGAGSPGVISGTWSPAQNIVGSPVVNSSTGIFTAASNASVATVFSLSVSDGNQCVSDVSSATISVQTLAQSASRDTAVVIGQTVDINMYQEGGFTYSWTPLIADLSCTSCPNPVSTSTVDVTYTVIIADTLGCSEAKGIYKIIIEPKTSVDVPTAFTPNGDMVNDIVYVGGWGIKKLNYFRIYNRWGQLLFESTDVKVGWDGYFNGVPQNMETYVYQVSVQTYLDEKPVLKAGTVKIIR